MKLERIATSVMVAESGSLSEATRRLRVSRSVVSDNLDELSARWAPLLQCSTRKVSVIKDGLIFLARRVHRARGRRHCGPSGVAA